MRDFKFFRKLKHYINEHFEFIGYTPIMYNPYTFTAVKGLLYRDNRDGSVRKIGYIVVGDEDV